MNKICLLIIYNHNFERNIPVIEKIYSGRFSYVYQIMPFYRGNDPHVIGVYENSYQFNGYIPQALPRIVEKDFTHYVVVADDMVLNPGLNEENIIDKLHLEEGEGFITYCRMLENKHIFSWSHALPTVTYCNSRGHACEWRQSMPSIEDARNLFYKHGYKWQKGVSSLLYKILQRALRSLPISPWQQELLYPFGLLKHFLKFFGSNCEEIPLDTDEICYPLVWGYSDFIIIPGEAMPNFSHYCGVFAAMRLFVESAIPTALVLACKKLKTLQDIGWKCETGCDDFRIRDQMEKESGFSYRKFLEVYPKDYVFIHPIKLSRWKDLP